MRATWRRPVLQSVLGEQQPIFPFIKVLKDIGCMGSTY